MEDKLKEMMDQLTLEETEELLAEKMTMEIDEKAAARIRQATFAKSGIRTDMDGDQNSGITADADARREKRQVRWFGPVAAVLAVCLAAVAVIGIEDVSAAIRKMFGLAPGYGIIETDSPVLFVVEQRPSAENESIRIELSSGIATEDTITLMFWKTYLNMTEEEVEERARQEWEQQDVTGETFFFDDYRLHADNRVYDMQMHSYAGGGLKELWTVKFALTKEEISAGRAYWLEQGESGLMLEFVLADYQWHESPDEIGYTQVNNNISLTAVSEQLPGGLKVELYSLNDSRYHINSYMIANISEDRDLHLLADGRRVDYEKPDSYGSGHNSFYFLGDFADSEELALKLPQITVQTVESAEVKLPVPAPGQSQAVDMAVTFADGTLYIDEVSRTEKEMEGEADDSLRIPLRFESESGSVMFSEAQFMRLSAFGKTEGGGYAAYVNEDGVYEAIDFQMEAGDEETLRLRISNPTYYLLDEYTLLLN